MQPNQIKLLCSVLFLCCCFATSTFAQAKAAPSRSQERTQARQTLVAKKAALHAQDATTTQAVPQTAKATDTPREPLQMVAPLVTEDGASANPTEAVKPN